MSDTLTEILPSADLRRIMLDHPVEDEVLGVLLQGCYILPPGVLYYKRLEHPTAKTVQFTPHLLKHVAQHHGVHHLVWDLRGRKVIQPRLHRQIITKISMLYPVIKEIAVVMDESNSHLRMAARFGIRLSEILNNPIQYSIHTEISEALMLFQARSA